MKIQAFAATEKGGRLSPFQYDSTPLGAHEVRIRVSHCGICHSDVHLIDNDWRNSTYPLVPGHEAIGEVVEKGSAVHHLQIGQRVGVGWQEGSCMDCEWCVSGQENLCPEMRATCKGHHGGFADYLQCDGRFAFAIPDGMDAAGAAPLLCGGITVYSPLRRYEVRHWHKVGVVGIGGLGHLGLRFAAAMGCEVTAFSSTAAKADEARYFGAKHFVATREDGALKAAQNKLDFILVTATADLDWNPYVRALRPNGMLCFVTGESSKLDVPISAVLGGQKSINGSIIGGRAMMAEMLDFAARKGVEAQTEVMAMSEVNAAIGKVRAGTARYRMVLEA